MPKAVIFATQDRIAAVTADVFAFNLLIFIANFCPTESVRRVLRRYPESSGKFPRRSSRGIIIQASKNLNMPLPLLTPGALAGVGHARVGAPYVRASREATADAISASSAARARKGGADWFGRR